VINSCDSGATPERGLAQASIAAAFLRNGARNVVATLYPVPDRVAANFSRAFYAQYDPNRGNVAAAVRHAQQALRRSPNHDDAWAAYFAVVAGDETAVR
jgi:CHAT domain-containing protein